MKQVKYFCDCCKKEIGNPKEELSCIEVRLDYVKDWTTDLPMSKMLQDIRVCSDCGEHLNEIIKNAVENNGFFND